MISRVFVTDLDGDDFAAVTDLDGDDFAGFTCPHISTNIIDDFTIVCY